MFERYDVTRADVERQLGRPLTGNPTSGEVGVLAALNAHDPEGVRRLLRRARASMGHDFTAFVERLVGPSQRASTVAIQLSHIAHDRYAVLAESRGLSVRQLLERLLEGEELSDAPLTDLVGSLTRRAGALGDPELLDQLSRLAAAITLAEKAR